LISLLYETVDHRKHNEKSKEEQVIARLLELCAESDMYSASQTADVVVVLQERKNGNRFLTVSSFEEIRTV